MPRDSNGNYSLPNGTLATTGQTITVSQHNPAMQDIASSLTGSLPRNGSAPMGANLPMSGYKITGMADGTAATDAATYGQVLNICPVGSLMDYAGSTAPSGWLLCYGQAVSRTTYSALFTALGTTYGVGDGSTTFNIPDCRGRARAGKDNMGGTSADRLTGLSGGVNGDVLGAVGGLETHTLTTAQLAAHTHTVPSQAVVGRDGWTATGTPPGTIAEGRIVVGSGAIEVGDTLESLKAAGADLTVTLSGSTAGGSAGSGSAHNNVQPTIVFNTIIRTGV